jgi:hypothetical protein
MNCSTECPLDGTPRATLKGLLEDCKTSKDSSTIQYRTRPRTVQNDLRRQILRYCGQTEYLREKELTKKNAGDRIQDREEKVFSLCGVRLCNK